MSSLTKVALVQMKKLPSYLERRRLIQKRYNEELYGYVELPVWTETGQYYCARVNPAIRNDLMAYLSDKKIHTSVHYKPLHKYAVTRQNRQYPVADSEWTKLISLPIHPAMTDEDIDYVVYWIKQYFTERRG